MIENIKNKIKLNIKKLEMSKINFLNHKFKKYIVKYEEVEDNLKIINSNGDYKIVKNNIPNKIKIMEIISDHQKEMSNKINYYNNKKEDYKFIILTSSFFLIALGGTFIMSFFLGSYLLLLLTLLSFCISLVMYTTNIYKVLLFREEIKRLNYIKENKIVLDDKEITTFAKDTVIYAKNYFYEFLLKILTLIDNIKLKFN